MAGKRKAPKKRKGTTTRRKGTGKTTKTTNGTPRSRPKT